MRMASDRDPVTVVLVDPGSVGAAGDVAPPCFMVEIPLYRLREPGIEGDPAVKAEFAAELFRVDGVAVIVTGTIGTNEISARVLRSDAAGHDGKRAASAASR